MSKVSKWFDRIFPIAWIISRLTTKTEKDDEIVDKVGEVREALRDKS